MGHVPELSSHFNLYLVKISGWHAPSPTSCAKWCNGQNLAIAPPWITRVTKHTKRWDMFQDLAHIPTCIWWKFQVDTPPRSPTSCAECFSPILSYTLIVVVQWPKFGHSTTLNNKGYKAHKEMGHVPELSSHSNLYLVKISGWHAPSPTSCAKWCNGQNLAIAPPWITRVTKHTKRWDMFQDLAHIPTCIWWKFQVDTTPLPRAVLSVFLLFSPIHWL